MGTTDKTAAERQKRARQRRKAEREALIGFAQGIFDQVDTGADDETLGFFCRIMVDAYNPELSPLLSEPSDMGGTGGNSPPVIGRKAGNRQDSDLF